MKFTDYCTIMANKKTQQNKCDYASCIACLGNNNQESSY